MNVKELSAQELDCVTGGGIIGDANAVLIAASHAIVDGVLGGVGALANAGSGCLGGGLGPLPGGSNSGIAPKSTWL